MLLSKVSGSQAITTVLKFSKFTFYGNKGKKLVEKYPNKYKQISRINSKQGFDLSSKDLKFPLHVPLKMKYVYKPKKELYIDNTKDIQWYKLQGNQVLLAFEELSSLTPAEIMDGLTRLSIQPGQENIVWSDHPWINAAYEHIKKNPGMYRQDWTLRFYHLMKKLNNHDPEMWKFIYGRIEIQIFKMNNGDFLYFWEKYHNDKTNFSKEFVEGLFKLMEVRLRSFPPGSIIRAMQILQQHGRMNYFYTHNVFLPMFKAPQYKYTAPQTTQILKILMLYNIQKYDRFYDQFYPKLLTVRCENTEQARDLKQALIQMQDIFQSHIISPYIQYFQGKEKDLKNKPKIITEKQLYEIVQQDLDYFKQKLIMQSENK